MFTHSADLYDTIYATLKDYPRESALLAEMLRKKHPDCRSVLDVACGTGEHARLLVQEHGFRVDGLDLDRHLLDIAASKNPASHFWEGDMTDFQLPQRYDAVVCLFSSIGYVRTIARLQGALRSFRQHTRHNGVILVEPWFPPGVLDTAIETRKVVEEENVRIERVGRVEIEGTLSRLHFEYNIASGSDVRTMNEVHELGLFTPAEMFAAFESAGMRARLDPIGLDGRGMYIVHLPADQETATS